MSLSDLPDDILNLISIRLNGFDNCFLWMASDSILKQRLVNNVITEFDIKYTIPGRYLWPGNFLKKLQKLSRLSLVVEDHVYHLPIHNVKLDYPMPTLKYLVLDFDNSHRAFLQSEFVSSNNPTGPTSSSDNKYINLNDFYSDLEHLEIATSMSDIISFSIDFVRFLPQKLKTLLIPNACLKVDTNLPDHLDTIITSLPQTLTNLHIKISFPLASKAHLDLSKLPPNLTNLTTNATIDENSYEMIPKSLKLLNCPKINMDKLSSLLPTQLESLEIGFDGPTTTQLFTQLQNLQYLTLKSKGKINLDHIISACSKLKEFSCSKLVLSGTLPTRPFGDCLTKLVLRGVFGIGPEFISLLPESLRDLTVFQLEQDQQSFAFFSRLPRKLKSLYSTFEIVENISLLPQSLTFLRLNSSNPSDVSHFDRLPPKLETLIIEDNLPRAMLKELPQSLKALHMISTEPIDDEIVAMLPRGLRVLSYDGPDNITDAGIDYLPPNLERLLLENNTLLTDAAIARLPRTLLSLSLPQNPNLTDECVKDLPRKLTFFSADETTKITSKSCKDLPKYLSLIFLVRCKDWDTQMLAASKNELPQYVRFVQLGNPLAQNLWKSVVRQEHPK